MSIVAISETYGSHGTEIGRELSRALGWEFADREIIAKAAERYGEAAMELQRVTEEKPTLWERFSDSTQHYLSCVEATIFELAAQGRAILVGHGAAIMLREIPHVLRVRVTAPEPLRAARVSMRRVWPASTSRGSSSATPITSAPPACGSSIGWTWTIRSSTTSRSTPSA